MLGINNSSEGLGNCLPKDLETEFVQTIFAMPIIVHSFFIVIILYYNYNVVYNQLTRSNF